LIKGFTGEESTEGFCKRKGLVELSTHIDEQLDFKLNSKEIRIFRMHKRGCLLDI